MSTYEGNLQNALENLLYRDRSRKSLKSTDLDVLSLFSGDEEAVIHGLKTFHTRHEDKTDIIHNGNNIEVKAYDLFPEDNCFTIFIIGQRLIDCPWNSRGWELRGIIHL